MGLPRGCSGTRIWELPEGSWIATALEELQRVASKEDKSELPLKPSP